MFLFITPLVCRPSYIYARICVCVVLSVSCSISLRLSLSLDTNRRHTYAKWYNKARCWSECCHSGLNSLTLLVSSSVLCHVSDGNTTPISLVREEWGETPGEGQSSLGLLFGTFQYYMRWPRLGISETTSKLIAKSSKVQVRDYYFHLRAKVKTTKKFIANGKEINLNLKSMALLLNVKKIHE